MALVEKTAECSGIGYGMALTQLFLGQVDPFVDKVGMGGETQGITELPDHGETTLAAGGFQV